MLLPPYAEWLASVITACVGSSLTMGGPRGCPSFGCALTRVLFWTGPHRLDLGDILYAPNTLQTPDGRTLMLGWLQELRSGGGFDYAGCLSVPRELSLQGAQSGSQLRNLPDLSCTPARASSTLPQNTCLQA